MAKRATAGKPDHAEDWESTAVHLRTQLRKQVFGEFPKRRRGRRRKLGKPATAGRRDDTVPILLHPEPDLPLPVLLRSRPGPRRSQLRPACCCTWTARRRP